MSNLTTPRWLYGLLLLLALALMVVTLLSRQSTPGRTFDLDDAGPTGLAALERWLQAMDYKVRRATVETLPLDADVHLLLIYGGGRYYTEAEATRIRQWAMRGGTVVLLGFALNQPALSEILDIWDEYRFDPGWSLQQAQPVLPDLPAAWDGSGSRGLDIRASSALPVVIDEWGTPTLALHGYGDGLFWFAGGAHTFTNAALRDANQAALLPALLRTVPPGGVILIDAYHADYYATDEAEAQGGEKEFYPRTLQEWLYRTPVGQAILTSLLLIFGYLLLYGRRLGPSLPVVSGQRRREAAEYVAAMAAIQRRARLREAVARHHKQRLKRYLGHMLQISPNLPDAEFLQRLTAVDEHLSSQRMHEAAHLLQQLSNAPGEEQLLDLVNQIDNLTGTRRPV